MPTLNKMLEVFWERDDILLHGNIGFCIKDGSRRIEVKNSSRALEVVLSRLI